MSRLGKIPIKLPNNTQAKVEDNLIVVKGPKGELRQELSSQVIINITADEINLTVKDKDDKKQKALWGLYWRLINNMVKGVNDGFEKKLEVVGVGFRVSANGNKLNITVGFSHPVIFTLPEGVSVQVDGQFIILRGTDKQLVGETAAQIRRIKKPDPYKGKGIKYVDEIIRKKEGKTAVKSA